MAVCPYYISVYQVRTALVCLCYFAGVSLFTVTCIYYVSMPDHISSVSIYYFHIL